MKDTNIGMIGPDSMRLAGRRIGNLPIAESAQAKQQMPSVYAADKATKIACVKARYPKATVAYLQSRIRECRQNIERVQNLKDQQRKYVTDYTSQLTMCEYRDTEIAKIAEDDPDRRRKIKELKKRFPPYDVEAMKLQIAEFDEACKRCDKVIIQEQESIAELSEVIGRCRQRDLELKSLGDSEE